LDKERLIYREGSVPGFLSEPFNTFDFAIDLVVSEGNNASIPPAHGAEIVAGFLSKLAFE
jgi:hypothetical protein